MTTQLLGTSSGSGNANPFKYRRRRFIAEDRTRTGKAWMIYDFGEDPDGAAMHFFGTDQLYAARCADKLERELNHDPEPGKVF